MLIHELKSIHRFHFPIRFLLIEEVKFARINIKLSGIPCTVNASISWKVLGKQNFFRDVYMTAEIVVNFLEVVPIFKILLISIVSSSIVRDSSNVFTNITCNSPTFYCVLTRVVYQRIHKESIITFIVHIQLIRHGTDSIY